MDIVININHNYVSYTMVMLESLLCNGSTEPVTLHVLYESLSAYDIAQLTRFMERRNGQIRIYRINSQIFQRFPDLKRWSVETLFRLKIPEVLPQNMKRVLYLDVDIIVERSLEQLYAMDFAQKSLTACRNMDGMVQEKEKNILWNRREDIPYFNAGVMLLNLEKIRQTYNFQKYCSIVSERREAFPYLDQDLLNYVFGEDANYIPAEQYNCIIKPEEKYFPSNATIYHFGTADKPWLKQDKGRYYEIWWKYARKIIARC